MKYGYTRTSTKDKQDDDLQRRALIDTGVDAKQIFSDQVSGSREARSRSGWTNLEGRLCEGDELVVWRIDRIGRSMIDVITTVKDLLDRGIEVRSLSDGCQFQKSSARIFRSRLHRFWFGLRGGA